jgi:hypothetical protein
VLAAVRYWVGGTVVKLAYVFFTELACVNDGLVGRVEGGELLLCFGREGEEEVVYD